MDEKRHIDNRSLVEDHNNGFPASGEQNVDYVYNSQDDQAFGSGGSGNITEEEDISNIGFDNNQQEEDKFPLTETFKYYVDMARY